MKRKRKKKRTEIENIIKHLYSTWAVPPERLVHSINRCSSATAGIERAALQPSACEATTLPMHSTNSL